MYTKRAWLRSDDGLEQNDPIVDTEELRCGVPVVEPLTDDGRGILGRSRWDYARLTGGQWIEFTDWETEERDRNRKAEMEAIGRAGRISRGEEVESAT